jgi:hypothetical protein
MCQQNFAAHDEARLRSYMTEFVDHQLVAIRKVWPGPVVGRAHDDAAG